MTEEASGKNSTEAARLATLRRAALAASYVGATAGGTVGAGANANLMVGGSDRTVIGLNERRHRLKYALARTQSQKAAAPGGQRRAFYLIPANRGAVAKAGPRRRATTTGDLPLGLTPLLGN